MTHEVVSKAKTEGLHRIQTHYLLLYFPEVDALASMPKASSTISSKDAERAVPASYGCSCSGPPRAAQAGTLWMPLERFSLLYAGYSRTPGCLMEQRLPGWCGMQPAG